MSVYFTGKLMDFAPGLNESQKWMRAPDMIYSFKNIGKAEITGLEAEVRRKIGPHFSTKLGYTYLHAINKSDPLMPKRLLDRPTHKLDIGISYEDKKTGWSAQLWGDYYIKMLDSNTLANRANYYPDILEGNAAVFANKAYQEKSFGIWNLMVQKKLSEDAMVYLGVNNIFNHRDDDRAAQERVFRIGANFAFDTAGTKKSLLTNGRTEMGPEEQAVLKRFIARPFDTTKAAGITFFGDWQLRFNAHGGKTDRNPPIRRPPPSTRMPYGTCGTKMSTVLSSASVSVQMHAWGRIRISASSAVFPETGASSLPTASQAAEGLENSSSMRSISPVIRRNGIFPSDV